MPGNHSLVLERRDGLWIFILRLNLWDLPSGRSKRQNKLSQRIGLKLVCLLSIWSQGKPGTVLKKSINWCKSRSLKWRLSNIENLIFDSLLSNFLNLDVTIDKYQKPESLMELLSRNDENWPLKLSSLSRIRFSRLFSKLSEIDIW